MHPKIHAQTHPGKPALIVAETGEVVNFADYDWRSNQGAHLFRAEALEAGDRVALLMENHPRYLEIAWAAQRCGLLFVCISSALTAKEAAYIVEDSGSTLLITSPKLRQTADAVKDLVPDLRTFMVDGAAPGYRSWDQEIARQPATPLADERAGSDMLYSSGTTGRPKGIRAILPDAPDVTGPTSLSGSAASVFGMDEDTCYLCPAPLYHAAPLRWSMTVQKLGGTVVLMEKFDPEKALRHIETYRINASQWVPTHFVRMLKLPDEVRSRYDLSSLRLAIHAAAPCPVPLKRQMIEWWGPILFEYYAGTESNGMTAITSEEWLRKPGSVGRGVTGILHICDDEGHELPPGAEGLIYFEGGPAFAYHNDPEKTASATNHLGWTTLGDVGRLDEDGYLFLTDRKSFMIISGGVNVYPQEIENLLVLHPAIADAAVIGAPDPDLGEKVVAVVQPLDWASATDSFAEELRGWLREQLAGPKVPRQIDFRRELPRQATGKLYKRLLREEYWAKADADRPDHPSFSTVHPSIGKSHP